MKTYTIKDRSEFTTCSYCGMPLETGDTVTERDDMPYCSTHCANQDAAYPTRTLAECDAENRAARQALERREMERLAAFVNTFEPLAERIDESLLFAAQYTRARNDNEQDRAQLDPLYLCACGNIFSVGAWDTNCAACDREIK